jgi:hypothetical protein
MDWIKPDDLDESDYKLNSFQHHGMPTESFSPVLSLHSYRYRGSPKHILDPQDFVGNIIWRCLQPDEVIVSSNRISPGFTTSKQKVINDLAIIPRLFQLKVVTSKQGPQTKVLTVLDTTSQVIWNLGVVSYDQVGPEQKRKTLVDGKIKELKPMTVTWFGWKIIWAKVNTTIEEYNGRTGLWKPLKIGITWQSEGKSFPVWRKISEGNVTSYESLIYPMFLQTESIFLNWESLNWQELPETFLGGRVDD